MKRLLCLLLAFLFLSGCSSGDAEMDAALKMRKALLDSNGCTFTSVICADFTDSTYTFSVACTAANDGTLTFTVSDPDTIAGISGMISGETGQLIFDEEILAFETIAQGRISPVSAPWLMIKTLRSGYISACGKDEGYTRLQIDDSYAQDALHLDIWLDSQNIPVRAEILWKQQRVITMDVRYFTYV